MSPYDEVLAEFENNLTQPMSQEAQDLFEEVYQQTIEHSLSTTKWEGDGRTWVLKQVGRIARKAQAETPGTSVSRNALAKAINEQAPLAKRACKFGQTMKEGEEAAKEEFGIYCIILGTIAMV